MTVIGPDSVYLCHLCQQPVGPGGRCNSGIHQGPDDPNGWRGEAVEYVRADLHRGAVEALKRLVAAADGVDAIPSTRLEAEAHLELREAADEARALIGGQ